MANASTLLPPAGGDQSRGWEVLLVHSILLAIGIILLFARFYVRIFIVRNVGLDDYFITLGVVSDLRDLFLDPWQGAELFQVSTTASMILAGWQIRWGFGRHEYYLMQTPGSREQLVQSNKISSMLELITVFDLFFIKFSIGFFLLRVFGTKKICRWAVWSTMGFVLLATVINAVTLVAQCRPLDKLLESGCTGEVLEPEGRHESWLLQWG